MRWCFWVLVGFYVWWMMPKTGMMAEKKMWVHAWIGSRAMGGGRHVWVRRFACATRGSE